MVPPEPAVVRLCSHSARHSDTMPWIADGRRLGVLVGSLVVGLPGNRTAIPLDRPGFGPGWWPPEWHDRTTLRRWTDGDAVLPLPERRSRPLLLKADIAGVMAYPNPGAAIGGSETIPAPGGHAWWAPRLSA